MSLIPSHSRILYFGLATALPIFFIAAASLFGGIFTILAVLSMTASVFIFDTYLPFDEDITGISNGSANILSVILAMIHFALLALVIWALAHQGFQLWENIGIFISMGMFAGQISNSNAHELIHRPDPMLRRLGTWVYISLLFGHHASAHTKCHHVHVATPKDPNSAPLGMTYYTFLKRAWIGSFVEGFRAESALRARSQRMREDMPHPYYFYVLGSFSVLMIAGLIAQSAAMILIYIALVLYATAQLMLSDYVQHYGLQRQELENGKYEPVGPQHSWNSPHWYSNLLLLNAPRHSDHHTHPNRHYPDLELDADTMPMLPRALPTMAMIALWPQKWFALMDHRAEKYRFQTTDPTE